MLVVDDSSPDGTGEIADRLAGERDDVEVLHRAAQGGPRPRLHRRLPPSPGRGRRAGAWRWTPTSPTPRPTCPRLLDAVRDADLVIGSRYVPGGGVGEWGALRRAISRGGSVYARGVLGVGVHDLTGGFKCFRREVLEAIDLGSIQSRGYAFQVETTYRAIRAGFRVVEVPITFRDRRVGASKMSRGIVAEAIWKVPAMRIRRF